MNPLGQPDIPARRAWLWLVLIMLVGTALRLYRLGVEPLWHDEVFELVQAEELWLTLTTGANVSSHPPLYAVFMYGTGLLGLHETEWGVRILAAVLGILTIPAVYLTASHLFTRRVGLVAAAVVTLSTFHIVHSQDAKSYILLPLVATLLVYASVRAWDEGGKWWPIYTILAALSFYSQAFVAPLLILLNGWYLVEALLKKRPLLPWFIANVAAFLLVLPWIVIMLVKASDIMIDAENWWLPQPGWRELAISIKTMAFGYSDQRPAFRIATLACAILGAVGAWSLFRTHPRHAVLTVLWFLFPVLALYGISQITNSIFIFRSLLSFAIALYILVAAGLLAIPRMPLRIGAAVLLFAATLPGLSDHYFQEYDSRFLPHRPGIHLPIDYDLAAEVILDGWQPGDRILLTSGASMLPLYAYGIQDEAMRMTTTSASPEYLDFIRLGHPPLVLSNPYFRDYHGLPAPEATAGAERIWFVFGDWEQEFLRFDAINTWRWMDARFAEIEHHAWRGIEVFLYEAEDPPEVVLRDFDDGVRATQWAYDPEYGLIEREKILPDYGIVRKPLHERRGPLIVSWQGEDAFTIENESGADVLVEIHVVQSAQALPIAAWLDEELAGPWRVNAWYNPAQSPPHYEVLTAGCTLVAGQTAEIQGAIPARYTPLHPEEPALLCWFGPNDSEDMHRARLSISLDGRGASIEDTGEGVGWRWSPLHMDAPLSTFAAHRDLPIAFTATGTTSDDHSYANLAWLALSSPEFQASAVVMEDETIEPGEARRFPLERIAPRTDVWVFERGEDGRTYHIFRNDP